MLELLAARSTLTIEQAKQTLGLPPGGYISPADLKRLYLQKAQAAHPDKGGTTEQIQDLNEAYDILRGKAQPAAPSYDFRNRAPHKPSPPPPNPSPRRDLIKPHQLEEIMTYIRHQRSLMNVFKWKKLGLHRITPFSTYASGYSHLTEDQGNQLLRILRAWQESFEPLASREQIAEVLRSMRAFEPPLTPDGWDQLRLNRIVAYPHHGDLDISRWTEVQAENVLRILRPAAQTAQSRRQEPSRSTAKPRATKRQLAQIIAANLTSEDWYALGLNRIMRFPQVVADYNDLTKDEAAEIIKILKKRSKPEGEGPTPRPRSTKSTEPTARARERMYDAYDRADGSPDYKFAKMLIALRKRINATTDPAKREGIAAMLREELEAARWSSAEKVVLRHILEVELRGM